MCIPCLFCPQQDWEVIDDPHAEMQTVGECPQDVMVPGNCEGYLLKRRKWPLKGWHKVSYWAAQGFLVDFITNDIITTEGKDSVSVYFIFSQFFKWAEFVVRPICW